MSEMIINSASKLFSYLSVYIFPSFSILHAFSVFFSNFIKSSITLYNIICTNSSDFSVFSKFYQYLCTEFNINPYTWSWAMINNKEGFVHNEQ